MGMRARFRRLVGIFGAVSVIAGTFTGAALAFGQGAASAGTSSAFSLDLGTPTTITQNTIGDQTPATQGVLGGNAGDGWNFTVTGWTAGDKIVILTGTPNGGPGVECNTQVPFGVNQTTVDMSNYVYFSAQDTSTPAGPAQSTIIEATSGSLAPIIWTTVTNTTPNCPDAASAGGDMLTLTFQNSAPSPGTTAQVYLGYANAVGSPASIVNEPLVFDTGFGAATGAVPFAGWYNVVTAPITVPSDATVIGETPGANVPASGIHRITGADFVPPTAISNFTISETGGFAYGHPSTTGMLPPYSGANTVGTAAGIGGIGSGATEATNLGVTPPDGDVCVVLDNSTAQNLIFNPTAPVTWSVNPGASTAGYSAAAGPPTVLDAGLLLQLPVANPANAPAVWTASGMQLLTIPGLATNADGPVWAYVYYVFDTAPSLTTNGGCLDANGDPWNFGVSGNFITGMTVNNSGDPTSVYQLGYVQLTTVSELANSIYGATAVDTAAQSIGHQFNYANGECIGHAFFQFRNPNGGVIFVATANDYHDALGASYPAGADNSAVALTDPNTLSQATADIIRQEGVQTVYLVGGPLAISNNVQNTLANTPSYQCGGVSPRFNENGQPENLTVIRIFGTTADDTNALLATFPGAQPPTPWIPFGAFSNTTLFNDTGSGISTAAPIFPVQNMCIVVTDANFQDAVSGSALAYGWPMPLIVTPPGGLSLDAYGVLFNDHCSEVIALGGTLALSDTVINNLAGIGVSALRIAGIDGSDTSTQLASFELAAAPAITPPYGLTYPIGLGFNNNDPLWANFVARTAGIIAPPPFNGVHGHVVLLARGDYYADADTASVLAVHNGLYAMNTTLKPLVLAESPSSLGTYVTSFLNKAGLAVSGLAGELPAFGWSDSDSPPDQDSPFSTGEQMNNSSSSVYTIQPIGGPIALGPGVLFAALTAVTAG